MALKPALWSQRWVFRWRVHCAAQRAARHELSGSCTAVRIVVAGRFGAWNRDGNTFVHVDAVQRGGVAYGLTLLSFTQDRRLSTMLVAERATHAGDHWMLEQVQLTQLDTEQTRVEELHCVVGILRFPPTAHA